MRGGLESDPWGLPALLAGDGAVGVDVCGGLRVGGFLQTMTVDTLTGAVTGGIGGAAGYGLGAVKNLVLAKLRPQPPAPPAPSATKT